MTTRTLLNNIDRVRNISVIAHVDHGKSTLSDSLLAASGLISVSNAGTARWLDTGKMEKEKGITIKSTGVTMVFEKLDQEPFVVNLIDSPGHVDFSSEVTAALRVTDGALVVVDCIEGVCVQTKTVLQQALVEKIKPVLVINKIDRAILELQYSPEEAYQSFCRSIESFNVIVASFMDEDLGDVQVDPLKGTVAFCAGLLGAGFTLNQFAEIYAEKWKMPPEKVRTKLWGNNFFDLEERKWYTSQKPGTTRVRGFCKFVLEPLYNMFKMSMSNNYEELSRMMTALNLRQPEGWESLTEKKLMKAMLQNWIPAADALLEMIQHQLPSPPQAQSYRYKNLYNGPLDDIYAQAIKKCDPEGPLMMYVSKLVKADASRFYAFGRVFSGTLRSGQKVRIAHKEGSSEVLQIYKKTVQRSVIMLGKNVEAMESIPAGCTAAVVGIDQYILKTCTITDVDADDAQCFHDMSYSVSPVVQVAVQAVNAQDLPKLVEGLKYLSKTDPLIQTSTTENGEHIISGAGELHLEVTFEDLKEFAKIPLRISEPIVSYRETIVSSSTSPCMSKSPNKLNRIYLTAETLGEKQACVAQFKKLGEMDVKERSSILQSEFQWDPTHSKKIISFGPEESTGTNVIVDCSTGQQHMKDIEDSVKSAFVSAALQGPLCGEPLRGVRFNITDAVVHQDNSHRGPRQICPATQRAAYAAMLSAKPSLLEPVYKVEIMCPQDCVGSIYGLLTQRRGEVESEEVKPGLNIYVVSGYLPVKESFGFTTVLRSATSGQAFLQSSFSHWQVVPGDVYSEGSLTWKVVQEIRKRKNMDAVIPTAEAFTDKL